MTDTAAPTVTTVRADEYPKSLHPNRTDYPDPAPVECYYAPRLYPTIEGDTRRGGHAYRNTAPPGQPPVWTCRNCEPRP